MLKVQVVSETNDLRQFSDLLDESFSLAPSMHYLDDFPVWDASLHSGESVQRFGIFDQQTLISTAAVRIAKIRTISEKNLLKIGIIGAVATSYPHRGKGLASKVVLKAVNWAREKGAVAVFLWGSEHSLYQKLGFQLCGRQNRVLLTQMAIPDQGQNREIKEGWTDGLFELIRSRITGLVLQEQDISWYRAHRNVQWFYQEWLGKPVAYVAMGRGIDLPGVVHEWGGEGLGFIEIFRKVRTMVAHATLLGSPERLSELEVHGLKVPKSQAEYLCLGKILNPSKLIRATYPHLDPNSFLRGAEKQLIPILLGGPDQCQLLHGESTSPLPLWFWGLDGA